MLKTKSFAKAISQSAQQKESQERPERKNRKKDQRERPERKTRKKDQKERPERQKEGTERQ